MDTNQDKSSDAGRPFDAAAYLQALDNVGERFDGVPTGFPSVDSLLGGGPRRGDLVVLGGDEGSGKSSLALAMALRAAQDGAEVAFFSGEYSTERLFERSLAIEGRARVEDLRHGRLNETTRASVGSVALKLRNRAPLLSPLAPNGFAGLSDLLIPYLGLDLIVVDPLQSLAVGDKPQEEELAHAVRELKALAVRRECAVLLVSHLARVVRGRPDPRPVLEDFGALGAIRHHADIVLGLFRQELYDAARDVDGAAELHVLKHRNGPNGWADLFFYKQWLRFEDMVDADR